jgi:hypothetical protein
LEDQVLLFLGQLALAELGQDRDLFNPTTKVWTVAKTAAEIKFRANDDWKVNYGDGR